QKKKPLFYNIVKTSTYLVFLFSFFKLQQEDLPTYNFQPEGLSVGTIRLLVCFFLFFHCQLMLIFFS
ncbi:hypothetical protein EDC94DRAFT_623306, partial [Helicostylum pulchrum]